MATADEILEVRNNTNTTTAQYSDTVIGGLIDDGSVNCASATIWRWELGRIVAEGAEALKKTGAGIENHEYNDLKSKEETYRKMYDMYKKECDLESGESGAKMVKTYQPSVAGIIGEDQINEYLNS